jgi:hypothetical protein
MESGGWVAWGAFAFGGLALTMWGGGAMKKKKTICDAGIGINIM